MSHPTQNIEPPVEPNTDYDTESAQADWDSPERAQTLVESYVHDGSNVLDIGIGTGQAVKGYREKGARIIGIDSDKSMLKAAQEVTGDAGAMRQGDINEELPIGDLEGRVDVVQAIGVLEFAEDIEDVFDQVVPTIKKGGVFVFTVEALGDDTSNNTEHYPGAEVTVYRHSSEEIYKLLADKGLSLVDDEAYDGYDRGDMSGAKVPYHIYLTQKQ